jgi:hypothetical protein
MHMHSPLAPFLPAEWREELESERETAREKEGEQMQRSEHRDGAD